MVNPIKKQSKLRLELLGACLRTNLVNTVRNILQEELKDKNVELGRFNVYVMLNKKHQTVVPVCTSQVVRISEHVLIENDGSFTSIS